MLGLLVLVVVVLLPWLIGYAAGNYWAALVPGVGLIVALANYLGSTPAHADEVDVQPFLWIAFSALAVLVCLGGAALRRRTSRHAHPS
jgi:hypothetical protein